MGDWCRRLCADLDNAIPRLAEACCLHPDDSGPDFERNLGLLLRWQQDFPLAERFKLMTGNNVGETINHVDEARKRVGERLTTAMKVLNQSLFDLFDQRQIDDQKAKSAYAALLEALGNPELCVATTNYDRSLDAALEALGREVDDGMKPERRGSTPILQPRGLVRNRRQRVPVIHLHGAVGWYEREGVVRDHLADQPFNQTLGRPVVLYPDDTKDPTSDEFVKLLWEEFRTALRAMDRVFVLGHSLNDEALVRELGSVHKPIAFTWIEQKDAEAIRRQLPSGIAIRCEFGPMMTYEKPVMLEWLHTP